MPRAKAAVSSTLRSVTPSRIEYDGLGGGWSLVGCASRSVMEVLPASCVCGTQTVDCDIKIIKHVTVLFPEAKTNTAEFRAVVDEAAAHLTESSRRRAVDFFVEHDWVGRARLADCVELAGVFEEHGPSGIPSLPETPLGVYTAEEWIRLLTPRIEDEREAIWGERSPPWTPDAWQDAARWLREQEERGREALGLLEGGGWGDQPIEIDELAGVVADRLAELGRPAPWDLRICYKYWTVQFWSEQEGGLFGGHWTITHVCSFGSRPLISIGRLCEEVSNATGIHETDVASWVLFGVLPSFQRAKVGDTLLEGDSAEVR